MSAAAWRWIGQRLPSLSDLQRLTQIAGNSSSRSPSASAGLWSRPAARKGRRILTLHEPARFYHSGASRVRQFATDNQATKPHLYLVLDDQLNEYSDMDNDLDEGCGSPETPLSLPEPPILRIGPPTIGLGAQFAALGRHIIATRPATGAIPRVRQAEPCVTLTYDTKTALLGVSNILPGGLRVSYDAAIAVRNKLYMFESFTDNNDGLDGPYFRGGLHCLAADPSDNERDWTWRSLFDSSHFSWSWTNNPPEFPFDPKTMFAHAVHPQTGTIFVSARGHVGWGTFSYGTGGSGQWKRRADWVLPFKGHSCYDDVLGAWVGLRLHSVDVDDVDGYLCACHVMFGRQSPPKWKVGREKLFLKHPHWRHVDAKLVHMGERSKYCLVERLLPKGADKIVDKMKYVLRLTMFTIKYGEDGELQTMAHRPARFYKAPSYRCRFDVQGFCM